MAHSQGSSGNNESPPCPNAGRPGVWKCVGVLRTVTALSWDPLSFAAILWSYLGITALSMGHCILQGPVLGASAGHPVVKKADKRPGPHGAYILAGWPRYSWVKAESPPLDRGDNEVQRDKTFAQTTQLTSGKVGSELKIPLHSTLLPSHSLSGGQEVGPESGGQTTNPMRAALC